MSPPCMGESQPHARERVGCAGPTAVVEEDEGGLARAFGRGVTFCCSVEAASNSAISFGIVWISPHINDLDPGGVINRYYLKFHSGGQPSLAVPDLYLERL